MDKIPDEPEACEDAFDDWAVEGVKAGKQMDEEVLRRTALPSYIWQGLYPVLLARGRLVAGTRTDI
jgi:hypothetical protein